MMRGLALNEPISDGVRMFVILITLGLLLAGCGPDSESPATNLIVLSIDTLRADALGAYGAENSPSPAIDLIAREGMLFENAFTTAPWTLPAHASLLTGLYPSRHGIVTDRQSLASEATTLASVLANRGYRTGAFVNTAYLSGRFGLARGFETYEVVPSPSGGATSSNMLDRAAGWLDRSGAEPFFLFVNDYQVHSDYRAGAEHSIESSKTYSGLADGTTRQLLSVRRGQVEYTESDWRQTRNLYKSGVRQMDAEFAEFRSHLERSGKWQNTLVIITSDHGEEFFEHGGVLHGRTHYDELMSVPLIFHGPSVPAGIRSARLASLIDVLPTAMARLDQTSPKNIDGRDLFDQADHSLLFSEADHNNAQPNIMRSVRDHRYKLISNRLTQEVELFDVDLDPEERVDISADEPATKAALVNALRTFDLQSVKGTPIGAPDEATRQELEALGYVR